MFGLGLFEVLIAVIVGLVSYVFLRYVCRRLNVPKAIALIGLIPGWIVFAIGIILVYKIIDSASQKRA